MSRQLEQLREEKAAAADRQTLLAVEGGLEAAVSRAGGVLTGLAVKFRGTDVLLVIKAELPAGSMVAFVGSTGLAEVLRKAMSEAGRDTLRWREDIYRAGE